MCRLLRVFLLSASLLCTSALWAQTYPAESGRVRLNAMIEMPRGYLSGVCIMVKEGGTVRGSLFNEFGISALDFTYSEARDKVKLQNVTGRMNKWYIRRVLRRDLRALLHRLKDGCGDYEDEKYNIKFHFTPLEDDTTE